MARRRRVRDHTWSPRERAVVIAVLAIAMGSLFLTTYTLALGDPVPRRIDAALVGDAAGHARTIEAVQQVTDGSLAFRRYGSLAAAREAIDLQRVYAALELRSARPTLYVAGAAGASVARALEAALALTLVAGPALGRLPVPVATTWGILALHVLAVASFASLISVLMGRWAILPTWLFFVVLGNSSSGGAVSPPLLPPPFA